MNIQGAPQSPDTVEDVRAVDLRCSFDLYDEVSVNRRGGKDEWPRRTGKPPSAWRAAS